VTFRKWRGGTSFGQKGGKKGDDTSVEKGRIRGGSENPGLKEASATFVAGLITKRSHEKQENTKKANPSFGGGGGGCLGFQGGGSGVTETGGSPTLFDWVQEKGLGGKRSKLLVKRAQPE